MKRKTLICISILFICAVGVYGIIKINQKEAKGVKDKEVLQLNEEAYIFAGDVAKAFCSGDVEKIKEIINTDKPLSYYDRYKNLKMEYVDMQMYSNIQRSDEPRVEFIIKYRIVGEVPKELKDEISLVKLRETAKVIGQEGFICQNIIAYKEATKDGTLKWKLNSFAFGRYYIK